MNRRTFAFALFLVIAAAAVRILRDKGFIPLPPNVAPITALALFGGTYLPRRFAFIIPLCAMVTSDLIIGFYSLPVMVSVYSCFVASGAIGLWLRTRRRIGTVVGATLAGSVLFFLVTNAAVWRFGSFYPQTLHGLSAAYAAGLPFFRNTVLGDLGFVALIFGAYEFAFRAVREPHRIPDRV